MDEGEIDIGNAEMLYTMSDEPPADMDFLQAIDASPIEPVQPQSHSPAMTAKLSMSEFKP